MKRTKMVAVKLLLAAVTLSVGCYWIFNGRQESLRLPGVVEIQEVRLGSKVGGRVEYVAVREGELVTPGMELIVLDVPELKAQYEQTEANLKQAIAERDKIKYGPRDEEKEAARLAFEAARARWQRMETGWREEEKLQALGDLETARADLKQAGDEYQRVVRLYQQQVASKAEFDIAKAALDRAQGRLESARAKNDMFQAGNRKEDKAEAEAELKRYKANYDLLLAGSREEDKAEAEAKVAEVEAKLRELKINLKEAVVVAPEHAVIEVISVRKGDLVAPNQPVIRVLRAEDLWVKVYVPETELGKIRLNQQVEVTVDAYPDKRFQGKVIQVASISEFTPRNVQSVDQRRYQVFGVKIQVADPQGIFKSGMAAEVVLPLHN
jgi:multidrug resistance efflux pump